MKILYIITQADGGGAQKYVLDLAERFKGSIAAGTEASQLFNDASLRGIPTFPLKHLKRNLHPWHDILAFFEIFYLVKRLRPDIVHLNSSKAGFLGSIAGKLAGAKTVFTAHGFFYFKHAPWHIRWLYTMLEWTASRFRNIIIAVSEEDREQGIRHRLLTKDKIITVHNGIRSIPFLSKDEARRELGLPDDVYVLGNIAQLYNRKAIDVFIKAMSLPGAANPKFRVMVIGEGPDRTILEGLIKQQSLEKSFFLPGFKPQAVRLIKAFDTFILSSRREGFPYVLLEAMQAGLPIIATDVGGNREAVGDAALMVKPEDPQDLARAITELAGSPQLQSGLAQKALARSAQFTDEKMFRETEAVYRIISQTTR